MSKLFQHNAYVSAKCLNQYFVFFCRGTARNLKGEQYAALLTIILEFCETITNKGYYMVTNAMNSNNFSSLIDTVISTVD